MKTTKIVISMLVLGITVLCGVAVFLFGPFGMESAGKTPMDYLFLLLIVLHLLWLLLFLRKKQQTLYKMVFRMPEVLFAVTMVMFLFSYIYASNANMDYIQRFAESSGNLRLAPDSTTERLNSLLRYLPFMLIQMFFIVYFRVRKREIFQKYSGTSSFFGTWGIPLAVISGFLYAVSQPSFIRLDGIPALAWICMVPVLTAVFSSPKGWGIFYGVFFGVTHTMLANYWLGTFSLITLQFITIYYLIIYILFMIVLVYLTRNLGSLRILAVPVLWTVFDFLRSLGFMGYPWNMLGTSQYDFTQLIQIAALTGVWGVSFLVYGTNSLISQLLLERQQNRLKKVSLAHPSIKLTVGFLLLLVVVFAGGSVSLGFNPMQNPGEDAITVALIQQNTDPRKDDYEHGLEVLQRLTDEAMAEKPDLVAWSETAFVPNIRRWSQEDPDRNYYAGLVDRLLRYQRGLNTWLLTGNDDYFLVQNDEGEEVRHDYNASILFAPDGTRTDTYHKIHLVPFTEYFPFKEQMPWLYDLLINFDINLWTPGEIPLVFEHPKFKFSTPICFEDSFPGDVRQFVRSGAEVILNISNDFWSLTTVEAKQHYTNALFRAVENRRHLLRATASGVTTHIDPQGRTYGTLPYYEEGYFIARIGELNRGNSLYTIAGDWFPYVCLAFTAVLIMLQAAWSLKKRRGP